MNPVGGIGGGGSLEQVIALRQQIIDFCVSRDGLAVGFTAQELLNASSVIKNSEVMYDFCSMLFLNYQKYMSFFSFHLMVKQIAN